MPVPFNETFCGLSGALSVSTNVALRSSIRAGLNLTLIKQLVPGATCFPEQLSFKRVKSFQLSPAITALLMYKGVPPTLVTVILFAGLGFLTTCLPKLRVAGVSWTLGCVWSAERKPANDPKTINMRASVKAEGVMISFSFVDQLDSECLDHSGPTNIATGFKRYQQHASAAFKALIPFLEKKFLPESFVQRSTSLGRHRADLLPVLEDSFASRRRLKLGGPWAACRTPAGPLVLFVDDLVNAKSHLPGVWSAAGDGINLFGDRAGVDGKRPRRMSARPAGLRETERVAVGD
jgi:hypothetical protein